MVGEGDRRGVTWTVGSLAGVVVLVVVAEAGVILSFDRPATGVALATIVLVAITACYAWQTKKLAISSHEAARAAQGSASSAAESAAVMKDQLVYYYQPGVALEIDEGRRWPGEGGYFIVRVFPTSQASAFAVNLGWTDALGPARRMGMAAEGEAGTAHNKLNDEGGPHGAWTSARIAPGEIWCCLLDSRPPGALLVVTWRHIGKGPWRHCWTLTEDGAGRYDLRPEGRPELDG